VAFVRMRRLIQGAGVVAGVSGMVVAMSSTAFANVPLTKLSQDPYTSTSNYHKTEVEPDTFSFGSTEVAVFQVGRFNNGGANNTGWATTKNNGASWSHGFLPGTTIYSTPPGPWARISDPSVAYDAQDEVWMVAGLAIDSSVTGKAVLVSRSTNGGTTWTNPVTVSQGGGSSFYDKEWIACDNTPSSPFYGNCYVEWDDAGLGGVLRMSRSTNGGQTWSASTVPGSSVIGGQPLVQPNGKVVVPITGNGLETFTSNNGGSSYTGPHIGPSIQVHGVAGSLRDGGGLVSAEIDGNGKIFVAWQDCRFRSGCSANDIVFATTTNGTTFSGVTRIPIVPTNSSNDFFIPGIGVDPNTSGATAHIGVAYYFYPQANCSSSTCKLQGGFVSSTNGGATWSSQTKILGPITLTWLPFTTLGYMVGDYISTSILNGKFYPVWANARQGNCAIGQITSCHEFMVTPTGGLAITGGSHVAGLDRPVTTRSDALRFRPGVRTL
jgi:hypothetical protein